MRICAASDPDPFGRFTEPISSGGSDWNPGPLNKDGDGGEGGGGDGLPAK